VETLFFTKPYFPGVEILILFQKRVFPSGEIESMRKLFLGLDSREIVVFAKNIFHCGEIVFTK